MDNITNNIPQQIISPTNEQTLHENHTITPPQDHQDTHLPFVPVVPNQEAHQELLSTTDHLMQLIGNPVRTLLAISENAYRSTNTSIEAVAVLMPRAVTTTHRHLIATENYLRSIEPIVLRFRNQNLPEYANCLELFNRTKEAFDHTQHLFDNKNTPWLEFHNARKSTIDAYVNFYRSFENLLAAQASAAALHSPGAYHISAEESALEGSFYNHEPLQPQEPLEAIPVNLPIAHVQPLPEKDPALRLHKKAPYGPDGLPIVQAEIPIMMTHGLPVAEATKRA